MGYPGGPNIISVLTRVADAEESGSEIHKDSFLVMEEGAMSHVTCGQSLKIGNVKKTLLRVSRKTTA